jgi:hypothetical protein
MLALPSRTGPRPRTTRTNPHQQIDQSGPPELGDELVREVGQWQGVRLGPSGISVPGTRAFLLSAELARGPETAFMVPQEFAHLHPPYDGSLHLALPETLSVEVSQLGWGELHPLAARGQLPKTITLIYAPRNPAELKCVLLILRQSYQFACGISADSRREIRPENP